MSDMINLEELQWELLRPDVATAVYARTYYNAAGLKVSYVRVEPGGKFERHCDAYGHLLHFLAGSGMAGINEKEFRIGPGSVLRVTAGDEHSYCNTGESDLMLLSINL